MYNRLINQPLLIGAYRVVFVLIDKGVLEITGPTGLGNIANNVGNSLIDKQTGRVYDYA